jgi:hypothetical protein
LNHFQLLNELTKDVSYELNFGGVHIEFAFSVPSSWTSRGILRKGGAEVLYLGTGIKIHQYTNWFDPPSYIEFID